MLRGPLCSSPRFTPPHPICCPKSQMEIKRSTNPLNWEMVLQKEAAAAPGNSSRDRHLRQLAGTEKCLFVCLASRSLLFIQLWCDAKAQPHVPAGQGTAPEEGSPQLPAAGRHCRLPAGENRELCRRREKFGTTEAESIPAQPRQRAGRAGQQPACAEGFPSGRDKGGNKAPFLARVRQA